VARVVVRWLGIFAVLCAVVGVRAAQAAPVSALELRARQDFAAGRYEQAIEIFAELYAKTADPIFLRNIARCYQKQNRVDEAIANFREYLTKAKKLAPGEREEVEGFIRELEASRTPLKPAEPATPPPPAARMPAATEAPPAQATAPVERPAATASEPPAASEPAPARRPRTEVAAGTPSEDSPPRTQVRASREPTPRGGGSVSVPGVVLTIAGVAAIGGGVAFGLAARSAATSVASQYDPSRDSAGKRDATLQWVGYGVGAAALVAGVILLVRGPGEPETPPSSVQVGMYPGGAMLSGRF
jgi:hypothetical protein